MHTGIDDVMLNVSGSEGIPVTIMEAYEAGLPVLAYNVGGISEIMFGELSEYMIDDPEDLLMISKKICDIIDLSDDSYRIICEKCRSRWNELYNESANYRQFADEIFSFIPKQEDC